MDNAVGLPKKSIIINSKKVFFVKNLISHFDLVIVTSASFGKGLKIGFTYIYFGQSDVPKWSERKLSYFNIPGSTYDNFLAALQVLMHLHTYNVCLSACLSV